MFKNALLQYDLRRVKSISRYLILTFVFVWILFLYPNKLPAYAAVITSQLDDTSSYIFSNPSWSNTTLIDLGTGLTGDVSSLKFKFSTGALFEIPPHLREATSSYPDVYAADAIVLYFQNVSENEGIYTATSTDEPYTLDPTKYYALFLQPYYSGYTIYGTDSGNQLAWKYNGNWVAVGSTIKQIYFILESPSINEIEITFPPNATSTPDFNFWKVSGSAIEIGNSIEILSKDSGSTAWTIAGGRYLEEAGTFDNFIIIKNIVYPIDTYVAYAELRYGGSLIATSSLISFNIIGSNPEYTGFYPTPTSTATSSEWVITCDPESNLFTKSLCYLGQWLFMPRQQDFNRFNDLKDALIIKPPIGYFYQIRNALLGFNASSSAAFELPQSAALSNYIFNPIKIGLSFIIWLIFGFWVFNRIRKLEL